MWNVKSELFEKRVEELLHECPHVFEDKDGPYVEIYNSYDDELGDYNIKKIIEADDPELMFDELMWEAYGDAESELRWKVADWIAGRLTDEQDGEDDEPIDPADVRDVIVDMLDVRYPFDHFLGESVCVNIMVDVGDGNYDFTLNQPYRSWDGQHQNTFDEASSLLWLIRQQGYKKSEATKALHSEKYPEDKFLKSVVEEIENVGSHMQALTFLVSMTLKEWFELYNAQKKEEAGNVKYYPKRSKGRGYIVLDKRTMCGLYDPWNGGGSLLELQLQKDVRLPLRYIWKAEPDCCFSEYKYSIKSVYGMCSSAWRDTLKEIHAMKKRLEKKENDVRKS